MNSNIDIKYLLIGWRKLGKIQNEYHSGKPQVWALSLAVACTNWFDEYIAEAGTNKWNSKANCQQYARFVARKLGLPWPEDVSTVGDEVPFLIDIATWLIATSHRLT